MVTIPDTESASRKVRERLNHPVIDGDGHVQELNFVFPDFLKQVGGADIVAKWERHLKTPRVDRTRNALWNVPSGKHTIDRATAMLPKLRRARQEDSGIDFAVIYTTFGLAIWGLRDDELRRAGCRALNLMNADTFSDVADRMTPAAVIPMNTPDEAIAELDYAVGELGMKAIVMRGDIRVAVPDVAERAPELAPYTEKIFSLTIDSAHDYDPFWRKCIEHKVAPACHSADRGGSSGRATSNFVFNHLGGFAAGNDFFCRSLFMGGVTRRFPELNFAFLEGGVAWASQLYNDIVEHWEKRNPKAMMENLNPATLDVELMVKMFEIYGDREYLSAERIRNYRSAHNTRADEDISTIDEFKACGIEKAEDIKSLFCDNFYFGCESDDRLTAVAFDPKLNHFDARLKAMWGSDIGHWDVTDATDVLDNAYGMVSRGLINADDFRDFVYVNPAMIHLRMNPDFFAGTPIAADVAKLLAAEASA